MDPLLYFSITLREHGFFPGTVHSTLTPMHRPSPVSPVSSLGELRLLLKIEKIVAVICCHPVYLPVTFVKRVLKSWIHYFKILELAKNINRDVLKFDIYIL